MYIVIKPSDFNKNYLMLSEKIKNNVMSDGDFYRLYYSDENITIKGLFLRFQLEDVTIEKYFNKLKCEFNKEKNAKIIGFIKSVEKTILDIVPNKNIKTPIYRIDEQLQNDFIKIFNDDEITITNKTNVQLLLKISGIWCNKKEYGVTFRFFFNRQ